MASSGSNSAFRHEVWTAVRSIPRGRIMSYGDVAALLGRPRAARGVGWALAGLPPDTDVPWWRVVNRNGEISSPALDHVAARQRAILASEGVDFDPSGRIDRDRFGWWPPDPEGAREGDPGPGWRQAPESEHD